MKSFCQSPCWPVAPLVAALLLVTGCGEKEKPRPKHYSVTPSASETVSPPAVSTTEPVPGNPTTPTPAPESAAGKAQVVTPGWGGKSEAQKREVYMRWLQDFKYGTAAQRQKLLGEIRLTPLTAEEAAELEKLRQHYNVPPLR